MSQKEKVQMGAPSIQEFMKKFRSDKEAAKFILEHIYPCGEIVCPHCGCTEIIYDYARSIQTYACGHCRKTIIPFNGTIFENLFANYKDWLYVLYSIFVSRKSVSTLQLSRETHHKCDTILKVRRRMQLAMSNYDLEPFSGVIQMDEVYLGGSNHGRYNKESEGKAKVKYPVFGIYDEKTRRVYSHPAIANSKGQYLTSEQIKTFIESTCEPGSTIVSDDFKSYNFLNKKDSKYNHESVDHANNLYVNEDGFTTNGIEGYWGLVKKTYYSTHSFLSPKWIHLYLAEADFRYNYTDWEEAINTVLSQGVFFPQVIDIRQMGRFANKTYDLKDYRMILPKQFDDIDLKNITAIDIVTCTEPVYGILRKPYESRKKKGFSEQNYAQEWEELGLVKGGIGYKDYRNKITNTLDDIEDMLKDATKHKDVNTYSVVAQKTEKIYDANKNRQYKFKKRYDNLPTILQVQIKKEFPYMLSIKDKDKIREISKRISELLRWYRKSLIIFEG